MNNKTLAIVSYITLIGWLISFFVSADKRDELVKFHLKQSLGLAIVSIVLNVITTVIAFVLPSIASILSLVVFLFVLALLIIGCINASKETNKELPLIGGFFVNAFDFIK